MSDVNDLEHMTLELSDWIDKENILPFHQLTIAEWLDTITQQHIAMGNYSKVVELYELQLKFVTHEDVDSEESVIFDLQMNIVRFMNLNGQYLDAKQYVNGLLQRNLSIEQKCATCILQLQSELGNINRYLKDYTVARKQLEVVLEEQTALDNVDPLEILVTKHYLANILNILNEDQLAETLYLEVIQSRRRLLGEYHPDTLNSKYGLAYLYKRLGRYSESEVLYQETLKGRSLIFHHSHPQVISTLKSLGSIYTLQQKYDLAIATYARMKRIIVQTKGEQASDLMLIFTELAKNYRGLGDFEQAANCYQHLLTLQQLHLSVDDAKIIRTLQWMIQMYIDSKQYEKVVDTYVLYVEKSLQLNSMTSTSLSKSLSSIIKYATLVQDGNQVVRVYERILIISQMHLGERDQVTCQILLELSKVYFQQGKQSNAVSLLTEARDAFPLSEQTRLEYLVYTFTLGTYHHNNGEFESAQKEYLDAISGFAEYFEEPHKHLYVTHYQLGKLYYENGFIVQAESQLLRAYEGLLLVFESNDPMVLASLNTLAIVYKHQGKYLESKTIHETIIAEVEHDVEQNLSTYLYALANLASLNQEIGDLIESQVLYEQALQIMTEEYGVEHTDTLALMNNLSSLYFRLDKDEEARNLLNHVLDVRINSKGVTHPAVADAYVNLGNLSYGSGDFAQAYVYYQDAFEIYQTQFGLVHMSTMNSLHNMITMLVRLNKHTEALENSVMLANAGERYLSNNFRGSEDDKKRFLQQFAASTSLILSLAFEVDYPSSELRIAADNIAFETWFRRKGRVLDEQIRLLQQQSEGEALDDEGSMQTQLANAAKTFNNNTGSNEDGDAEPNTPSNIQLISDTRETGLKFSREIDTLLSDMPENSVLIQFAVYKPHWSAQKDDNIGVFVLHSNGSVVHHKIDRNSRLLRTLEAFRGTRNHLLAKQLYPSLIENFLPNPQQFDHIFISPDGLLNLIPFEILQDANGEMLLEKTNISYLSTGRDLLRLQEQTVRTSSAPFVLANPVYSSKDGQVPLPATQTEAEVLQRLFSTATVLTQHQATVEALRSVKDPRFLHIATHGFFEPDDPNTTEDDNPMTRSGLILAGSDEEDATRMLASEAVTLDLDGTELVVLSACESGLGKAENGEGVYGLRRALALAGARSQVVSLWSVDDDATAYFMESFYTKLKEGKGKANAMKETKMEMRSIEMWENPKYWAAFVLTGDWR